jgi:hypothetical protein
MVNSLAVEAPAAVARGARIPEQVSGEHRGQGRIGGQTVRMQRPSRLAVASPQAATPRPTPARRNVG